MPYLLAGLILPALLTWLLGDVMSLSDEDRFLLFVAMFVTFFIGSIAVAQLMEHGQRYRRNQVVQGLKPLQVLKTSLKKYRIAMACATVLLLGVFFWYPTGRAIPPVPQAMVTATEAPVDQPAQELALAHAAVQAWASAWAARNLDAYMAAYSEDFAPADHVTRKKWEQVRRQRLGGADSIEVKILDLTVVPLGRDLVKAVFIQKYQARGMNDLSRKTLVLKKQGKSWKIQSEQATPLKG